MTTSLNWEGQSKQIERYSADYSAPIGVLRFEERIDRLVNIEQWVGDGGDSNFFD